MKILLIEDEAPAARRLAKLLAEAEPTAQVLPAVDSIAGAVRWFQTQPPPDLLFCDIHLSDGLSFEIFQRTEVRCPVIFTTAYDEYALRAFRVNSIDYLLKPIDSEKLAESLAKYRRLKESFGTGGSEGLQPVLENLLTNLRRPEPAYRSRFLVAFRDRLVSVAVDEIAYFFSEQKITHLVTHGGKTYPIEPTLEEVEADLDPRRFFRLNRQVLACPAAITAVFTHFNGKLKLDLNPPYGDELFVSRERAGEFKRWLGA